MNYKRKWKIVWMLYANAWMWSLHGWEFTKVGDHNDYDNDKRIMPLTKLRGDHYEISWFFVTHKHH